MSEVTQILNRIKSGDGQASAELLPLVYEELRRLASRRISQEAPGNTLQATELVHEAYLRLVKPEVMWDGTAHFFGAAAEAMRRILVDRARARKSFKRGGDRKRVQLHDSVAQTSMDAADEILVVSDLLDQLANDNPEEAEIAKLCYFADFNVSQAAKALEIPVSTAHKRWKFARAWLRCEFEHDERGD